MANSQALAIVTQIKTQSGSRAVMILNFNWSAIVTVCNDPAKTDIEKLQTILDTLSRNTGKTSPDVLQMFGMLNGAIITLQNQQ